MRNFLLGALALTALFASTPALAGDPETCTYRDARLAQACRTNPDVRAYLLEPENLLIETYMEVPPVFRGWDPGEEDAVIGIAKGLSQARAAGCDYTDPLLSQACQTNPAVRERLRTHGVGPASIWYHLGPEIGGYAPNMFNNALKSNRPGAGSLAISWNSNNAMKAERVEMIQGAMSRALGFGVVIAKLHIIAVDDRSLIACGYAFTFDGQGDPQSGAFIFEPGGQSVMRATPEMMRTRCAYADAVLM